jgi:DNA-binding HxlR family transcriptional regulator
MSEPRATLGGVLGKDYEGQECALAAALEVLGERWTLLIVRDAFFGVRRYSDWVARLDIPRAVLAERLRGLVASGILVKRDDPHRAGRHVYELTPAGRDLWPALHALIGWGSRHRRRSTNAYRHAACDAELGPGAVCPSCGIAPEPEDVLVVPRGEDGPGRTDPVSAALRRPRRLLEPVEVSGPLAPESGRPALHAGA